MSSQPDVGEGKAGQGSSHNRKAEELACLPVTGGWGGRQGWVWRGAGISLCLMSHGEPSGPHVKCSAM